MTTEAPPGYHICDATLSISSFHSGEWSGRGFGRRYVLKLTCPTCGQERKLIKNWHGPTPNGAIRCGGYVNHAKQ